MPPERRAHLRWWLWVGAALTFAMVVVGGVTRLTQSGLSIVEWAPLMGVMPPIGEAQWLEAFDAYKQYPEYQILRPDMTMAEFRFIYYWEYAHRQLARFLGLAFLIPFFFFLARGYLRGPLLRRTLVIFGFGALQGLMGWLMVASGLVERPSVAHERLAAHLLLAFAIFALCLWAAADLTHTSKRTGEGALGWVRNAHGWLVGFGVLLVVQIAYGAMVAGLNAGLAFNTWPRMVGQWLPPSGWRLDPWVLNLLDNIATVQWIHRTIPYILFLIAVGLLVSAWLTRAQGERDFGFAGALVVGVLLQAVLGIYTLLYSVPLWLGALHQAFALVLFGVWVLWQHRLGVLRRSELS